MSGWMLASATIGLVAGATALCALWRPLPFLPAPVGALGEHAAFWAKLAVHRAFPWAFSDAFATYSRFWHGLGDAGRGGIEARVGVSAAVALSPFAFLAKPFLTPRDPRLFVRGGRRHEGEAAARRLRERHEAFSADHADHELAPGIPWPSSMWTRHTLLVGGVGSGKSTVLRPLIEKIVVADEALFLFDPKGEFTSAFDGPAIVAPWDRRSFAWDIARDLRNIADMRRFAKSVIAEGHDPMWGNAARQLLVGLLVHLRSTQGANWGWRELSQLVSLPQPALLAIMSNCHPEGVRAIERASVTTTGVLINLSAFCSSLHDLSAAWGDTPPERRVSVVAWAQGGGPRQLVLQGHAGYAELAKCYVAGMADVFATLINSAEFGDDLRRKIWFIADEFAQAGKLPVRALFEVGRSRGVRCVVACQDIVQVDEVYGEKFVKALLSMCGTLVIGQVMPGETAESLCKMLGSREVERPNVSDGGARGAATFSYSREELALYVPAELASRLGVVGAGRSVRLIVATRGEAHEIEWPIRAFPDVRAGHEPADWTLGVAGELREALSPDEPQTQSSPEEERARPDETQDPDNDADEDDEEARLQSVLREALGHEDPRAQLCLDTWQEAYWNQRLAFIPRCIRSQLLGARRAFVRIARLAPFVGRERNRD
ncbi:MAG: type IV secretion system DNA-binding domain-containing protein [Burkholderia gladioli]